MKLEKDTSKSVVSNSLIEAKTQIRVGNDELVMGILMTALYKNPIRTLVQEYVSNARDACRQVGKKDNEFVIHLPQSDDMSFRVRDFGPGMSPKVIDEIFSALGTSTKAKDNSMTGGFGLGSKSGFSYTSNFTITTFVDGVQRSYIAQMENGAASINLVSECETSEQNGTEIAIPVKANDAGAFYDAAARIIFFWEDRPEVSGNESRLTGYQGVNNKPVIFSLGGVDFVDPSTVPGMNSQVEVVALIDGVIYPVLGEDISSGLEFENRIRSDRALVLKFGNGQLDLVPSREALRYTDRTKAAINSAILDSMSKVDAGISAVFGAVTDIKAFVTALNSVSQVTKKSVAYNRSFTDKSGLSMEVDEDGWIKQSMTQVPDSSGQTVNLRLEYHWKGRGSRYRSPVKWRSSPKQVAFVEQWLNSAPNELLMALDEKITKADLLRKFDQEKIERCILLCAPVEGSDPALVARFNTIKSVFSLKGTSEIVLPKKVKAPRVSGGTRVKKVVEPSTVTEVIGNYGFSNHGSGAIKVDRTVVDASGKKVVSPVVYAVGAGGRFIDEADFRNSHGIDCDIANRFFSGMDIKTTVIAKASERVVQDVQGWYSIEEFIENPEAVIEEAGGSVEALNERAVESFIHYCLNDSNLRVLSKEGRLGFLDTPARQGMKLIMDTYADLAKSSRGAMHCATRLDGSLFESNDEGTGLGDVIPESSGMGCAPYLCLDSSKEQKGLGKALGQVFTDSISMLHGIKDDLATLLSLPFADTTVLSLGRFYPVRQDDIGWKRKVEAAADAVVISMSAALDKKEEQDE